MLFRALGSGVLALALATSAVYAGDASPAGTTDEDIIVPVAPAGSLGGVSTAALIAGGALAIGLVALAVSDDGDDDDDDSAPTTPAN